jgi:hypothetical protein
VSVTPAETYVAEASGSVGTETELDEAVDRVVGARLMDEDEEVEALEEDICRRPAFWVMDLVEVVLLMELVVVVRLVESDGVADVGETDE